MSDGNLLPSFLNLVDWSRIPATRETTRGVIAALNWPYRYSSK